MAFVTATTNKGAAAVNPTVAFPSLSANDILIIVIAHDDATQTQTWTGFTSLGVQRITLDGETVEVFWKRATGSETGTLTAGANAIATWVVSMLQFSGRDTGNPPVMGAFTASNANNPTPVSTTASGVTALAGDDLVYLMGADPNGSAIISASSAPTGYTNQLQYPTVAGGQGFDYIQAAVLQNASAGATGTLSASFNLSTGGSGWATALLRIPAAGGAAASIPDLIMAPFHR